MEIKENNYLWFEIIEFEPLNSIFSENSENVAWEVCRKVKFFFDIRVVSSAVNLAKRCKFSQLSMCKYVHVTYVCMYVVFSE